MGRPPESSSSPARSSSSPSNLSSDILVKLERIASALDKLLEVSLEILGRLQQQMGKEVQPREKGDEKKVTELLPKGVDLPTLLELPDHLRNPLMALFKLGGRGTAKQVSEKLGISRPQASATLNSLVHLHLLAKKRQGKEGRRGADAIFMIPEEEQ